MRTSAATAVLLSLIASSGRTESRRTLDASVETFIGDDVRLMESGTQLRSGRVNHELAVSATHTRVTIDYAPAEADIVSRPRRRNEECAGLQLTSRWLTNARLSGFAGAGAQRGFADYRSVWLDEYYRQLFSGVPNYAPVSPHSGNILAGTRWAYQPTSGFLQGSVRIQRDKISPAYEPKIFAPLLRGRDRLTSVAARVSTENVLSPSVRTLVEATAVSTTGRHPRFSLQAAMNWAAGEAWTVRATVSGLIERPAFRSSSAEMTLERDWETRWFAGVMLRGYRDNGEVVDPLILTSAAPARRTQHVAFMLRWRGDRAAVRLEAGPYRTRHAALPEASTHFARLYASRNWLRLQLTAEWLM